MGRRSNGCITCRKRKVKCGTFRLFATVTEISVLIGSPDETKPACIRCIKATYICRGYDQPWFNEAPYVALAHQRAAERSKEHQENTDPLTNHEALISNGFLPRESVSQHISLRAFQDDICRSFVLHKLCGGTKYSKAMSWWLSAAPKVEIQARTLVSASKAMAASFYGRVHNQPQITIEGSRLYTEALHNLNMDLSHPVKAFTIETLGATMALNMYEVGYITLLHVVALLTALEVSKHDSWICRMDYSCRGHRPADRSTRTATT